MEFNLKVVLVSFKQCLSEEEEVLLDHYIAGWKGLVRCVHGAPSCRGPQGSSFPCWSPLARAHARHAGGLFSASLLAPASGPTRAHSLRVVSLEQVGCPGSG